MWLITTGVAAITATFLWKVTDPKMKLGFLSLMLWGAVLMILTDHIIGYEGGSFFEMKTDGIVPSGILLGVLMIIPVMVIWGISIVVGWKKRNVVKE